MRLPESRHGTAVDFSGAGAVLAITGRASLVLVRPEESRIVLEPGGRGPQGEGPPVRLRWAVQRVITG
jgi:hypothetical protein